MIIITVSHRSEDADVRIHDKTGESYLAGLLRRMRRRERCSQIKKIPTVGFTGSLLLPFMMRKPVTFFGMCGIPSEIVKDERRGMTYEFDYETEEADLNQYSIRTTFYRASEMKIDYNDLAAPMEVADKLYQRRIVTANEDLEVALDKETGTDD